MLSEIFIYGVENNENKRSTTTIGTRQSQTLSATPTHHDHIRCPEDMDERLASFMPSGTNYQVLDVIGEGAYGIVWCVLRHLVAGIPVYRP